MTEVYAVVEYFNLYDQQGGVTVSIHITKEGAEKSVDHIGRKNYEESWYEVEQFHVRN